MPVSLRIALVAGLYCSLALPVARAADAPSRPALTIAEAGPDYSFQGEYTGRLGQADDAMKFGVQVIALGDGKFRAVGYMGGLPGDGWDGKSRISVESSLENGVLEFGNDKGRGRVADGSILLETADGVRVAELTRVVRQSPTLGARPPEGAFVLFDGADSVSLWQNGRVTDTGLLMEGTTSKARFHGGRLHLEFQLSFMPHARGQGRSNSGCYLQGRYEVQILDSFGLTGEDNECGGIYRVGKPLVNMCFPPLSWQTYDIDFEPARFDDDGKKVANARMTVRHNGVVIQDNIEVPKATTAAPNQEGADPGPVFLQNHRNPVRFRNIWFQPSRQREAD